MTPGTRLGPYEILAPIGAGGMGEVYRARDTKLDRDVAIKVLPAALAQDPERLARFEREAKVLAALNHPNIAQIYGLEQRALVMELVKGETLKGPFPVETALNYAKQIADALEAAHEKGITHRDLKPAIYESAPHVNEIVFSSVSSYEQTNVDRVLGSDTFPRIRTGSSERPGAVQGAPLGAAKRTLTARTRSEIVGGQEKGQMFAGRIISSVGWTSISLDVKTPDALSSAPLVFAVPLLRRKPYIRFQLLQEPIPRAGVAINDQPQGLWPVPRLPVRRRKCVPQPSP